MPTDDAIEALATATLPSRRLELRRDDDGLTISVVLTAVDVVEDPGRELSVAAAADFYASPGDELTLSLWSTSAIDEALLERLGLGEDARSLSRALRAAERGRPRTPEEAGLIAGARSAIALKVRGAEAPLPRIAGTIASYADIPGALDELRFHLASVIVAHQDEAATWPASTENDRLDAAFAELDAAGVVALHVAGSTQSAGWSAVMEAAEERDPSPAGGVFYHDQDLEDALEGRALHLAFGALADDADAAETVALGQRIVDVVRSHGLEPSWSGSPDSRIALAPFVWRRRRRADAAVISLRLDCWHPVPAALIAGLPALRELDVDVELADPAAMSSTTVELLTLRYPTHAAAIATISAGLDGVRAAFPALRVLRIADASGRPAVPSEPAFCAGCGATTPPEDGACPECGWCVV